MLLVIMFMLQWSSTGYAKHTTGAVMAKFEAHMEAVCCNRKILFISNLRVYPPQPER
jgi:uncharacterized membrane protein YhdT